MKQNDSIEHRKHMENGWDMRKCTFHEVNTSNLLQCAYRYLSKINYQIYTRMVITHFVQMQYSFGVICK